MHRILSGQYLNIRKSILNAVKDNDTLMGQNAKDANFHLIGTSTKNNVSNANMVCISTKQQENAFIKNPLKHIKQTSINRRRFITTVTSKM